MPVLDLPLKMVDSSGKFLYSFSSRETPPFETFSVFQFLNFRRSFATCRALCSEMFRGIILKPRFGGGPLGENVCEHTDFHWGVEGGGVEFFGGPYGGLLNYRIRFQGFLNTRLKVLDVIFRYISLFSLL